MKEELKIILLKIARASIREKIENKKELTKENLEKILTAFPELSEKGAVFVTIDKRNSLRGCIGSLIAHRPLIEDVILNAKSAAFNDPRFKPLSKEEFEEIEIEISVLTPPKEVEYSSIEELKNKIRPNTDGVILRLNNKGATFLPQVWESLSDFYQFFAHLCLKAGLNYDCLKSHPKIFLYQVEKFKESEFLASQT
jgi:AmmeMemoRadiSam system protein A